MYLPLVPISAVILFLAATQADKACYIPLGKDGMEIFPLMKELHNTKKVPARWFGKVGKGKCMLYKKIGRKISLILKIHDLKPNGHNVTVYLGGKRDKRWKKVASLGNESINSEMTFTGYRALKMIVHDDTHLIFYHENAYCLVPKSVTVDRCTAQLQRTSSCGFSCKSPQYVPAGPQPFFMAKCRSNHAWTTDFSTKCISLEKVMDDCFTIEFESEIEDEKPDTCNYSEEQISSLFPESNSTLNTTFESVKIMTDLAKHIHYLGLYVGMDAADQRSGGGACWESCLRDRDTKQYHLSCDSLEGWNATKVCYACRYKYKICEKNQIFFG